MHKRIKVEQYPQEYGVFLLLYIAAMVTASMSTLEVLSWTLFLLCCRPQQNTIINPTPHRLAQAKKEGGREEA